MSDNVQRATYYIGGKPVAYEEWSGDKRLPEILSQEECEALRGPDKERQPTSWWVVVMPVLGLIMWVAGIVWAYKAIMGVAG